MKVERVRHTTIGYKTSNGAIYDIYGNALYAELKPLLDEHRNGASTDDVITKLIKFIIMQQDLD